MYWNDKLLAVGSGFIGQLNDEDFLITSRHNLAGRNWETNELLSTWSVEPTRVVLRMQTSKPGVVEWTNRELPLLDEDELPLWYEHPELGRNADVAVLPIQRDEAYFVDAYDIARPAPADEPTLSAGDGLFVVGYPRGFTPHVGIPVWVRASVASEPSVGFRGLPLYLVDSRTTDGQSGSAVVLRPGVNRSIRMRDGSITATDLDDSWIAGVYSGRVNLLDARPITVTTSEGDEVTIPSERFDIGLVWTTGAILAAADGRTRFPATGEGGAHWEPFEDWTGSYDDEVVAD